MKEQQKHRDAFEVYFIARQSGMTVIDAVQDVVLQCNCSESAVYTWKREFDWSGMEAIRTHDVQTKVAEKTNQALADNKSWYLRIIHDTVRKAEESGVVKIENVRDFDLMVKQALTIQGDDIHDRTETTELLRGILEAVKEDSRGTVGVGVKSRFNDKSES